MQSKHFRRVVRRQELNEVDDFLELCDTWNNVTLVEVEGRLEHVFSEPDLAESIQQSFVEVVRHSTAVLDLTEHVTHSCPVDTLKTNSNVKLNISMKSQNFYSTPFQTIPMLGTNYCCNVILFYVGNKRCCIVLYCRYTKYKNTRMLNKH